MNVLTLIGHLVTDPVGRDTTLVREFRLAGNQVVAQHAGGS